CCTSPVRMKYTFAIATAAPPRPAFRAVTWSEGEDPGSAEGAGGLGEAASGGLGAAPDMGACVAPRAASRQAQLRRSGPARPRLALGSGAEAAFLQLGDGALQRLRLFVRQAAELHAAGAAGTARGVAQHAYGLEAGISRQADEDRQVAAHPLRGEQLVH